MSERITKVFGKDITWEYEIDWKLKEIKTDEGYEMVYTGKPTVEKKKKECNWVEICSFSGEPYLINRYISVWDTYGKSPVINISEDEEVRVEDKKFRADLNEVHLFTDKVVNETYLNSEPTEDYLLGEFNKQMIESNDKLKDYCNIHTLSPLVTDCIKLFKLVYGHDNYEIVDGKMKERSNYTVIKADNSYLTAAKTDNLVDAIRYTTSISSLNGVK